MGRIWAAAGAGALLGGTADFLAALLPNEIHGRFDEVAHHAFDIASDIADFGVFSSLDLNEGGLGEGSKAAGDFGFADAGWTD